MTEAGGQRKKKSTKKYEAQINDKSENFIPQAIMVVVQISVLSPFLITKFNWSKVSVIH